MLYSVTLPIGTVCLMVTGFVQTKPPQLVGQHLPIPKHCESEKQDWLQICTGKGGGQEPGFSAKGSYLKTLFQLREEDSLTDWEYLFKFMFFFKEHN